MTVIGTQLGAPVVLHDDQSTAGMHDLEVRYADGRVGAVEVTAAEDEQRAGEHAAIARKPVLHEPRLSRGWVVVLAEGVRVNTARAAVPALLRRLEAAGRVEVDVFTAGSFEEDEQLSWVPGQLARAQVQSATATDVYPPGMIKLTGPMPVAYLSMDPDDVVTFVEDFVAARPTDVAKLLRADADERHLFIWSGVFSTGWITLRALGLDVAHLPTRAPRLPAGITHVWIACEAAQPSRTVMWSAPTGWVSATPGSATGAGS